MNESEKKYTRIEVLDYCINNLAPKIENCPADLIDLENIFSNVKTFEAISDFWSKFTETYRIPMDKLAYDVFYEKVMKSLFLACFACIQSEGDRSKYNYRSMADMLRQGIIPGFDNKSTANGSMTELISRMSNFKKNNPDHPAIPFFDIYAIGAHNHMYEGTTIMDQMMLREAVLRIYYYIRSVSKDLSDRADD